MTLQNVAATIEYPFEAIVVDNADNSKSIFEAYNEGVLRAGGDILCFMHEDILFHTSEWGKRIVDILQDDSIGIMGVIGCHGFSKGSPSSWTANANSGYIIQGNLNDAGEYYTIPGLRYMSPAGLKPILDVVMVDGLFMACKRCLFDSIRFDSLTFDGFHCYDYDICMQAIQLNKRVVAVTDLAIEHRSPGVENDAFRKNLRKFYDKWNAYFPICRY